MSQPRTFFLLSIIAVISCVSAAHADLVCEESQVTLGDVKAGKPLSQRYTFVNRGPEVAEITAVQPSCGCLKPHLEERHLRPGESGVLVLEVNTLTSPAGPNAWRVQIMYSAGGKVHDLTLALRATVVTEITIQPAALVLQTETRVGHEVTVTDGRPVPLAIRDVRTTAPTLRATLLEARTDDVGRRVLPVRLDVTPGFPPGRHDETLQIFTSDPEYPELRVPVTVVKQSRSAVSAAPAEVTLNATGAPLPARVVLLRASDGQAVEVERLECEAPAVHCTWARGPGSMTTLRIQIDSARVSPDGVHSAIRVQFKTPAGESLVVPVHCSAK